MGSGLLQRVLKEALSGGGSGDHFSGVEAKVVEIVRKIGAGKVGARDRAIVVIGVPA